MATASLRRNKMAVFPFHKFAALLTVVLGALGLISGGTSNTARVRILEGFNSHSMLGSQAQLNCSKSTKAEENE